MTDAMILGTDWLFKNNIIIDLLKSALWRLETLPPYLPTASRDKFVSNRSDKLVAALTAEQQEKRRFKFPTVWTQKKTDCGRINACVKIVGELVSPQKQYWYPREAETQLVQIIQDLEEQGVIRKTNSPFNSPVWPVMKADGPSWRLTIDYRRINKGSIPMAPIVADMTQVIQKVQATSRYFSVIDLANCFFAIPLHPDSQDRFAFTIRDQQYTFQRLP